MEEKREKTSTSTVARDILVYVFEKAGTSEDAAMAWQNAFAFIGIPVKVIVSDNKVTLDGADKETKMGSQILKDLLEIGASHLASLNPDLTMVQLKDYLRDLRPYWS